MPCVVPQISQDFWSFPKQQFCILQVAKFCRAICVVMGVHSVEFPLCFHITGAAYSLLKVAEVATRKAIASTKTKELLESSGDAFERALLPTQIQALNYAAHLASVAASNDPDPTRSAWSKALSREMKGLYSQCVELLSQNPHGR